MNKLNFEQLNLSEDLLRAISNMGFSKTTPIQAQTIPEIIAGRDIIGQASTGTGKTAAFAIPAIEKIDLKSKAVQVIVLCPTRELAIQVSVEINKFLKYKKNISALPIYGGQPIHRQLYALRKNPQIIIGTPGRTLDHIDRGTLRLSHVKMVILDEADEMLAMGFRQDIEAILQEIKQERQTVLFSATMSSTILQLTKRYQKNPKFIKVLPEKRTVPIVEQVYFDVETPDKTKCLMKLIDVYDPKLSIIFCNTKRKVDKVAKDLRSRGYLAEGLHGDIRQAKRDNIMSKFRRNKINILVATDVAARGVDVANVEIVFNYEIPRDVEYYIHRIGRTARAGKTGRALSLVSRREVGQLHNIKRYANVNILRQQIPSASQIKTNSKPQRNESPKVKSKYQTKESYKNQIKESFNSYIKESSRGQKIESPRNRMKVASNKKEGYLNIHLEEKANKVFGRVKQCIGKEELVAYSRVMEKLIGGNNHSSADVAAALLKMVIDVDSQKLQQS
jgi:ATP-dependent RNA helicase DeaD